MEETMKIFRAETLLDGTGGEPLRNVEIVVENGHIREIVPVGLTPTHRDHDLRLSGCHRPPRSD